MAFFQSFYNSTVPDMVLEQAAVHGFWNAIILRDLTAENTYLVCLIHCSGRLASVIRLDDSKGVRCRFSRGELVITDHQGRFISVRLADGAITFVRVS